jgi:hypothetical protein
MLSSEELKRINDWLCYLANGCDAVPDKEYKIEIMKLGTRCLDEADEIEGFNQYDMFGRKAY